MTGLELLTLPERFLLQYNGNNLVEVDLQEPNDHGCLNRNLGMAVTAGYWYSYLF